MHDPVPQTGQWLQSIVQGYFNYYAVPGNLTSLGVFRDRVLALWCRTIRRRSQKHRINWTRTLVLVHDGSLNRVRSIPFLTLASPPLIRDKNRMHLTSARPGPRGGCVKRREIVMPYER
jgi:hypothetical protein